jgi:hypothetical protein
VKCHEFEGSGRQVEVEVEVHSRTGPEDPGREYMYSSILSLTSDLDRVGGQSHDLADLPPGKNQYLFIRG